MVQCIADDGILLTQQRFEDAAIGIEARGIEYSVVGLEKTADGSLELLVHVLRTADKAHTRHAVATTVHHTLGSLYEARIV